MRVRLRALVRRGRVEAELEDELRFHLEKQIEVYIARGWTPAAARNAAVRDVGSLERHKDYCRDAWGRAWADHLARDVRDALRSLRHAPAFTIVALVSLALGIGANTTIFTFVNGVLLRPLPYPGSDRLVVLHERPLTGAPVAVHPFNFLEWRARTRSFEFLALVQAVPTNILGADGAEQVTNLQSAGELFRAFGVDPAVGRLLRTDDGVAGREPVAVLGFGFWQRRFAGRRDIIGERLQAADGSFTIVGVAPPGLHIGQLDPDIYTPLVIDPAQPDAVGARSFQCYGRLKRGTALDTARADLSSVASTLAQQHTLDRGYTAIVDRLKDDLVHEGRPALLLLMAVVGLVLAIACVNLSGLLGARGLARRHELALRAALGAGRGRIVSQLVVESLILSLAGGVAGWVLAIVTTRALVTMTAGALNMGRPEAIAPDGWCLLFTFVLSTVTALLFGLLPAWQASRAEPNRALSERSRGGSPDRHYHRMRRLLVVAETALAVVLLVGAGLLLRTLDRLVNVALGFEPDHTVTASLFLGDREPAYRIALLDRIVNRVAALPGVSAVGTIQFLPLSGMTCGTGFWREGQAPGDAASALPTNCSLVSPGYLAAMRIPLVDGRPFDARDRTGSPRVVIVNRAFARRYFPGGRAIGHRITVAGPDLGPAEIVGIAGDTRHAGLTTDPQPTVYLLHAQSPGYITNLVVRATGDTAPVIAALGQAVHEVDRTQAIAGISSMRDYVDRAMARPRLYAAMLTAFAALALVLSLTGVYGLAAYTVSARRREIGIRLALGAERGTVFRGVAGDSLELAAIGLTLGLAGAWAARRAVESLLYGITSSDGPTYALAAVVFGVLLVAAVILPARRAANIDAVEALRCE